MPAQMRLFGMVRLLALLAVVALAATGCDLRPNAPPRASAANGAPIVLERRDDGFAMALAVTSDTFDAGQPIGIEATLTYEGPAERATVWGSGSGVVSFSLRQLDGNLDMGAAITSDCAVHEFVRMDPVAIPYEKSAAWSDDDPNAGFYRAFVRDPVLRLPAGTWRITANAGGFLAPCEMDAPTLDITLEAEFVVR